MTIRHYKSRVLPWRLDFWHDRHLTRTSALRGTEVLRGWHICLGRHRLFVGTILKRENTNACTNA